MGVLNTFLPIHGEAALNDVNDLAVVGDGNRLSGIESAQMSS
jgi:hypothetical protein